MRTVARINVAPVKGFRLLHPEQVSLGPEGVVENRRFFLVGADGQRIRTSVTPWLSLLGAEYDAGAERLRVRFPDGTEAEGDACPNGGSVHSTSGSLDIPGRVVAGPWDEPLAAFAGQSVRLARADRLGHGLHAPVTLVSDGSLARLAAEAGVDRVDPRRFRMLFELDGCDEHEEDSWDGRLLRVGDAVLRVGGPVDRCAVTTRDPDTAERDLDTLRILKDYRGQRESDGAVLFGVYADVARPGLVRVGDPVEPVA
jgi:uncharacterized protein YcbX